MRNSTYTTIKVARTSGEADVMIGRLRNGGLHPTDLALAAPLTIAGTEPEFPVEVPIEEAELAKKLLEIK
jgi:hypothetical protein